MIKNRKQKLFHYLNAENKLQLFRECIKPELEKPRDQTRKQSKLYHL